MVVIEITRLRLKGVAVDDPALLESLSLVRTKLQTNSRFFSCIEDSRLIYIFGIWPSLDAHLEFLASPVRDEVLGPQEAFLEFQWTIHVELDARGFDLVHDAQFIAVERISVRADRVHAYDRDVSDHVLSVKRTARSEITHGWRCDAPAGAHEGVLLTSSRDIRHVSFASRHAVLGHKSDSGDDGPYKEIQTHKAQNMEPPKLKSSNLRACLDHWLPARIAFERQASSIPCQKWTVKQMCFQLWIMATRRDFRPHGESVRLRELFCERFSSGAQRGGTVTSG